MHDICPLEYRYGSSEMRRIFDRRSMVKRMVMVEAALMRGLEEAGLAPRGCWEEVMRCGESIAPEDIDGLEEKSGHEVWALTALLAERCGRCGGYVHLGATSNDIIDSAWSLAVRDALRLIRGKLRALLDTLSDLARRHVDLVMVGRTHGQHALPITLGFKLAVYAYEHARSLERLCSLERRVVRGKISGAVGTMAAWGDKALIVEETAMKTLGLAPHPISTQVAPRDGFAELLAALGILASQLDRLALEVRELSRPEIGELREKPPGPIGSSTMPHKANPVRSERVSSLARLARSLVVAALENIPLWHERDLTNSANERILLPHAFLILDEMLDSMHLVLRTMEVGREAMRRNLELMRGAILSEALMVRLVEKGVPRLKAYNIAGRIASQALSTGSSMLEAALADPEARRFLDMDELRRILEAENYLGSYRELVARALSYVGKAEEMCREEDT